MSEFSEVEEKPKKIKTLKVKSKKLKVPSEHIKEEDLPTPSNESLSLLSSLISDAEEFETKVYPVVKDTPIPRVSKFLSGSTKFVTGKYDNVDPETYMLMKKQEWETVLTGEDLTDIQSVDIVKIPKAQKKKLVESLDKEIKEIRNFIVSEMAPPQMAVSNALEDSKQIIEESLGIKLSSSHKLIEVMIRDAVRLRMFNYIADRLKLTKEEKKIIIDKFFVLLVKGVSK